MNFFKVKSQFLLVLPIMIVVTASFILFDLILPSPTTTSQVYSQLKGGLTPVEGRYYKTEKRFFEVILPEGWKAQKSEVENASIIVANPLDGSREFKILAANIIDKEELKLTQEELYKKTLRSVEGKLEKSLGIKPLLATEKNLVINSYSVNFARFEYPDQEYGLDFYFIKQGNRVFSILFNFLKWQEADATIVSSTLDSFRIL